MFTLPLLAAISLMSSSAVESDICVNVNGPCTIIIRSNGDMVLSNGQEITEPIPDCAMDTAEQLWRDLGCMGR